MTATTTELTGLVFGMDEREYHARPELSSTGVRQLLDSPARFQWAQAHPVTSLAFDVGTAVHTKVLGTGWPVVTYPDEHLTPSGNVSTKAATVAWEKEQRARGAVVLSRADMAKVDAMAEAVLAHKGARAILERNEAREVSTFAEDPDTGVRCRARFDVLGEIAADLKTTSGSASLTGFGRAAAAYGYPVQEAHYLDTLEWATGERPTMRFIVVEKAPPHLVAVHEFDDITRFVARELAAKARRIYADCKAANNWPAYGDEPLLTQIPGWWLDQGDDTTEIEF